VAAASILGPLESRAAEGPGTPQAPPRAPQRLEVVDPNPAWAMNVPAGPVLSPADPNPIPAIDCVNHCPPGYEATWKAMGPVSGFQEWGQGEYVGRARLPHVPVYRLRVDDQLEFLYRVTRDKTPGPYKINVGDELMIESSSQTDLRRTLVVLPDGTISL